MKFQVRRVTGFIVLFILSLALAACSGTGAGAGQASTAQPTQANTASSPVKTGGSVMAEGKVVPAQDASLSFSTGGVIEKVLIAEGDQVKAGQPVMQLTGSEKLQSAVATAELELLTAQQALNDLNANAAVARSQAELALATAEKALDKAKNRMYSKDYSRGDPEQIDIARANYIIAEDAVSKAEDLYNKMSGRAQDDPIRAEAFSQVAAARQKRDVALANLNFLLDKPNKFDVDEQTANLHVAQANVDDAQRKLDLLKNGPDANQLALAQERVKNATVAVTAAKSSLDDLQLRAPFAGTVTAVNSHQGEFVGPGIVVITMADLSNWQVNTTDLTELNVAKINMGQPAMVRFDALPDLGIIGRVTQIKSLGENRQGDVVYTVVLKLENGDPRLRWNMTASVTFLEKNSSQ